MNRLVYVSKVKALNNKGMLILVNKNNPLPGDYRPYDMVTPHIPFINNDNYEKTLLRCEAAKAMEKLFCAASSLDLRLYGISFFRPYFRQNAIYRSTLKTKGEEYASLHIAKAGHSEHQTGLSADISSKSVNYQLCPEFGMSDEGIWLANNAHHYGFIMRYPINKEDITGYCYEPWHIRYVGKAVAHNIYFNQITFEEWYEVNKKYLS